LQAYCVDKSLGCAYGLDEKEKEIVENFLELSLWKSSLASSRRTLEDNIEEVLQG
jgi:hypothetical protein